MLKVHRPINAQHECKVNGHRAHSGHQTLSGKRPIVFLLPGMNGSRLRTETARIWPAPLHIARHGIACIGASHTEIQPDGLMPSRYGALTKHLRKTNDVVAFGYDWRTSTRDQAARLNAAVIKALVATADTRQPIRFVAHSMGGLVARMFIARHRTTWEALLERGHGTELVMLGAPHQGTMSAVQCLIGADPLIQLLDAVDMHSTTGELLSALAKMPGLLELLPDQGDGRFFQPETWEPFAAAGHPDWRPPSPLALSKARAARHLLTLQPEDAGHMVQITGCAKTTPRAITLREVRGRWRTHVVSTKAGDGRVCWDSGTLPGVSTWYANQTSHANLPRDPRLFSAIDDVLLSGATQRLPQVAPAIDQTQTSFGAAPLDMMRCLSSAAGRFKSMAGASLSSL